MSSEVQLNQLSITGLRPRAWICVGPGFSREDLKSVLLRREIAFVGDAFTTLSSICLRILGVDPDCLLGPSARQEVLRLLLADTRIASHMPELKKLRRQSTFFRKLERAIEAGRLAFAHREEALVLHERLTQKLGANPVREELMTLSLAYEAWLSAQGLWDTPRLLEEASARLRESWPTGVPCPEDIHYFSTQAPESRERDFWEALERHARVHRQGAQLPVARPDAVFKPRLRWDLWHTLDDAADGLADELAAGGWEEDLVLIPDLPAIRRTLKRALRARGIPEADPRDPHRLKNDESIKWALRPLTLVARGFERSQVIAWLQADSAPEAAVELQKWIAEIHDRGIRQGLSAYAGGKLAPAYARLEDLQARLGGRKTCAELAEAHLAWLNEAPKRASDERRSAAYAFFERVWREFVADTARIDPSGRRAPPLYWFTLLEARIAEAPAPVERLRPAHGVRVYRMQQAPPEEFAAGPSWCRVWILGLPPNWLTGDGVGDYWFSEREREVLSGEFAVRSAIQVKEERQAALRAWLGGAREAVFFDARYEWDGRERETIFPALKALSDALALELEVPAPDERGSHPRWTASYGSIRSTPPQAIQLEPLARAQSNVSATALDHYSRCGIQALAMHRWKLKDLREPDTDLWPEVRGNLLHHAVKLLMESRDAEGHFARTPESALELAWQLVEPRGLIRAPRVVAYVKSRLRLVLESFCAKEREYVQRARTRVIGLDDRSFRLEYEDFAVVGKPDRIDEIQSSPENPGGVFILDYKTSSALPNGTEMVERGYRLQLPFYALAVRKELGKSVLGVQFIELSRRASRSSGIFFKEYNGKEPGKLTMARGNSKSLLSSSPEETWDELSARIEEQARRYVRGEFRADPSRGEKECRTCRLGDLCGQRRVIPLHD